MKDNNRAFYDYLEVKEVLTQTRNDSLNEGKKRIAKFVSQTLTITESDSIIVDKSFSTLSDINYDTTIGEDMIIYTNIGTGPYNKKNHGGDITFKSLLGFKKSLCINCTGLAIEGSMVESINL